ncbi:MAG: serine acetyltransferase [Clostridia bacterium]|nr:serine acetyltransferase [Clostridia bacterium]
MSETMMERVVAAARTLSENGLAEEDRSLRGIRQHTEQFTDRLISAMFPAYAAASLSRESALLEAAELLTGCLQRVLPPDRDEEAVVDALFSALPEVHRQLMTDLVAAYEGDPAAASVYEIILCYPAFPAIAAYRLAHVLYLEKVPLLPRMMTEYAHRTTGIDIHPGAAIGDSFFIDHGTGVVIGETTTIGEHVKLYQHVTLGAKSFELGPDGNPVKGIKRHPDIGDRVVIYAGATILGGQTRIGSDCVIGGSVWLTHSVEAGKMVLASAAVTEGHLTRDIMGESPLESAQL